MKQQGFSLVLASALVCAILAGCGDDDDASGTAGVAGSAGTGGSGASSNGGSAGASGSNTGATGGSSGSAGSGGSAGTTGGTGGSAGGDSQTPPMGKDALSAWLLTGEYKNWHCETSSHEARSPSPHGFNRICSNDIISASINGTGDWPKGAAAVKELFESANSTEPFGYAVYLKTQETSDGGANWYWYEDSPTFNPPGGVVADGLGDSGNAKTVCVACHAAAGSDPAHTPSPGGRDQVYTPVE